MIDFKPGLKTAELKGKGKEELQDDDAAKCQKTDSFVQIASQPRCAGQRRYICKQFFILTNVYLLLKGDTGEDDTSPAGPSGEVSAGKEAEGAGH